MLVTAISSVFMVDSLSIRPASAVDPAKSRRGEEPIETVCNKSRTELNLHTEAGVSRATMNRATAVIADWEAAVGGHSAPRCGGR